LPRFPFKRHIHAPTDVHVLPAYVGLDDADALGNSPYRIGYIHTQHYCAIDEVWANDAGLAVNSFGLKEHPNSRGTAKVSISFLTAMRGLAGKFHRMNPCDEVTVQVLPRRDFLALCPPGEVLKAVIGGQDFPVQTQHAWHFFMGSPLGAIARALLHRLQDCQVHP